MQMTQASSNNGAFNANLSLSLSLTWAICTVKINRNKIKRTTRRKKTKKITRSTGATPLHLEYVCVCVCVLGKTLGHFRDEWNIKQDEKNHHPLSLFLIFIFNDRLCVCVCFFFFYCPIANVVRESRAAEPMQPMRWKSTVVGNTWVDWPSVG